MTNTSGLILPGATIVDLSHWQGTPAGTAFEAASAAGVVGVIEKFAQGGKLDPSAFQNSYQAWQAGIPLLGCYDFGTQVDDEEAFRRFCETDYQGELKQRLLMLDLERNPAGQMTVGEAERWVSELHQREGRWPVIYMGRDGPDGKRTGLPSGVLSRCDLMLPAYGPHEAGLGEILPPGFRLPQGDLDRGGCLRLWQFTDGTINGGPIPGLGRVDQSKVVGFSSVAALTAWWGS